MHDTSKFLSVAAVLGILTAGGFTYKSLDKDLLQPVGIIEHALVENPTTYLSHGSGVFITPTKFLTAGHVMPMLSPKVISKVRMENGDIYNVVGLDKNETMDVSYVTVDRPYKGFIPKINCDAQPRKTELINISNPLSMEFVESKVTVTGGRPKEDIQQNAGPELPIPPTDNDKFTRKMPDDLLNNKEQQEKAEEPTNIVGTVFFQGVVLPGQSGSPVFDKNGNIVGIVTVTILDPNSGSYTGLGLYVATSSICQFLQEAVAK